MVIGRYRTSCKGHNVLMMWYLIDNLTAAFLCRWCGNVSTAHAQDMMEELCSISEM